MNQTVQEKIAELELQIQELKKMTLKPETLKRERFYKLVSNLFPHEPEPGRAKEILDTHLTKVIFKAWKEYHIRASLDNKLWGVKSEAHGDFIEDFWDELDKEMGESHYVDSNYCEAFELGPELYEAILENEKLLKKLKKDFSTLSGGEYIAGSGSACYENFYCLIEAYLLFVEATYFNGGAICD